MSSDNIFAPPPPQDIVQEYGADTVRLFMLFKVHTVH